MKEDIQTETGLRDRLAVRWQLWIAFVLQIGATVGAIGYLSFWNGHRAVNEVAVQLRAEISDNIHHELEDHLDILDTITQINADAVGRGALDVENAASDSYLWHQIQLFPLVSWIYYGAADGGAFVGVHRQPNEALELVINDRSNDFQVSHFSFDASGRRQTQTLFEARTYDARSRPWYRGAIAARGSSWTGVYTTFNLPQLIVSSSLPVYGPDDNILGVVGVDYSLAAIGQLLERLETASHGRIFIMDTSGLLVASSADPTPYRITSLDRHTTERLAASDSVNATVRASAAYLQASFDSLADIDAELQLDTQLQDEHYFLEVLPFRERPGLDWLIVVAAPESAFMEQIQLNTRETIWLCGAAILTSLMVSYWLARRLTQPLQSLTQAAESLARGDRAARVVESGPPELRALGRSFNAMSADIDRALETLEARVEERTQKLRQSEQFLRAVYDGAEAGIFVIDVLHNGGFQFVGSSPAHARMSGIPTEALIGKTPHELLPPDIADAVSERYRTCLRVGDRVTYEEMLVVDAVEVWSLTTLTPVRDHSDRIVQIIGTGINISERRQAERAITRAKQAAEAANRAKSQFLANMNHELRTPLNAILGFAQLLERDRAVAPACQSYLDIINTSSEHLLGLIDDVLSLAKIEADKLTLYETCFDLHRLLRDLEGMVQAKASAKGIQLLVDRAPDLVRYVRSDEGKLRQLLINLLNNAIKFTDAGRVTLTASSRTLEIPNTVAVDFAVIDTGPGIHPEERDRLFEAFEQGDAGRNSGEGTGLGLAIGKRFARLLGGDLDVSSAVGAGSTFHLSVRVNPVRVSDVRSGNRSRPFPVAIAPQQSSYRIAVVEDNPANRDLLVRLLQPLGFEVKTAHDGQVGVELWHQWQPHLIWMDMRMPVMDGYEATRHIKDFPRGERTIVIALTASTLAEDRDAVLAAGCDDFVRKPFRPETIYAKLTEHLGVQFRYPDRLNRRDEGAPSPEDTSSGVNWEQCRTDMAQMPKDWTVELFRAAERLDEEATYACIARIPSELVNLSANLSVLASSVRYDCIMELTRLATIS